MAQDNKKAVEVSVEDKLSNLYKLQTMLSEIDKIRTLRGELPLEVQDLEDEISGLTLVSILTSSASSVYCKSISCDSHRALTLGVTYFRVSG